MSHKNEKRLRRAASQMPVSIISPEAQKIIAERRRQVEAEGYHAEHDDQHMKGELGRAALCYIQAARENSPTPSTWWPWSEEYWKPIKAGSPGEVDRERCLVKAGALLYAEIDRLNRLGVQVVNELKALNSKGNHVP